MNKTKFIIDQLLSIFRESLKDMKKYSKPIVVGCSVLIIPSAIINMLLPFSISLIINIYTVMIGYNYYINSNSKFQSRKLLWITIGKYLILEFFLLILPLGIRNLSNVTPIFNIVYILYLYLSFATFLFIPITLDGNPFKKAINNSIDIFNNKFLSSIIILLLFGTLGLIFKTIQNILMSTYGILKNPNTHVFPYSYLLTIVISSIIISLFESFKIIVIIKFYQRVKYTVSN